MKTKLFLISFIFLFSSFSFASDCGGSFSKDKKSYHEHGHVYHGHRSLQDAVKTLQDAVKRGNIEEVKNLLAIKSDIIEAVKRGNIEAVINMIIIKANAKYGPLSFLQRKALTEDVQIMLRR